jgi:hypothetical protein
MVAPPLLWTQFVVACYDEVSLGQLSELGSRLGPWWKIRSEASPRPASANGYALLRSTKRMTRDFDSPCSRAAPSIVISRWYNNAGA